MMHMVAKLHYESDMSQVEIARKLDVSTATISRLLNKARAAGIVRIEVIGLSSPENMTADLISRLGLKTAYVIDAPPNNVLGSLAAPLASILSQADLGAGSVLGIGWGRAIREVTLTGMPRLPGILTVALNGGMQQAAPHVQITEVVVRAAEQMEGTPSALRGCCGSCRGLLGQFPSHSRVESILALSDGR